MIVKCIDNKGVNLPIELFSHYGWHKNMNFEQISIGKPYVVYAIVHLNNIPFYLVCSDIYDGKYITYPSLLPSGLFEIIQNHHSRMWCLKKNSKDIGFKEILYDEYFYGNLVEGHENEVRIFQSIKQKIDQENG